MNEYEYLEIKKVKFYYSYEKNTVKNMKIILSVSNGIKKKLFIKIVKDFNISIDEILKHNIEKFKKEINKDIGKNEFIHLSNETTLYYKEYNAIDLDGIIPYGLWLSTMNPNTTTWFDFCILDFGWNPGNIGHICKVNMNNILVLNTIADIEKFHKKYSYKIKPKRVLIPTFSRVNWKKMCDDYYEYNSELDNIVPTKLDYHIVRYVYINWTNIRKDGYDGFAIFNYNSKNIYENISKNCSFYSSLDCDCLCIWNLNTITNIKKINLIDYYNNIFPGLF